MISNRTVFTILVALCLFVLQGCGPAAIPTQPAQQQTSIAPSSPPAVGPTSALPTMTAVQATRTPEPTNTPFPPTWTETRVPPTTTPSPTRTEVPPTPMARAGEVMQDSSGRFVVVGEKGERLAVPAIAGLKQEKQAINEVNTVIYRAEEPSAYGLKEGQEAGFFLAYVTIDNSQSQTEKGEPKQIGAVSLHPDVVKKLLLEARKKQDFVFPLPFQVPLSSESAKSGIYLKPVLDKQFNMTSIYYIL